MKKWAWLGIVALVFSLAGCSSLLARCATCEELFVRDEMTRHRSQYYCADCVQGVDLSDPYSISTQQPVYTKPTELNGTCIHCGAPCPEDELFCKSCPAPGHCLSCGRSVEDDAIYCANCAENE